MNIAFLHTVAIDPQKGGIEKVTSVLTEGLCANGHSVVYISMMDVYRETCDESRQFFFPNRKIYAPENEQFLRAFLTEKKIDLVIFQAGDDKRVPFPHIFKELGVRLFVAVHTDPEFYKALVKSKFVLKYGEEKAKRASWKIAVKTFLRRRKQKAIYKRNAKYAERIILLTEKFIPQFSNYLRAEDRPKICIIPNPVSVFPESNELPEKKNEILYLGRMNLSEKRVDLVLKIWAKIQDEFPDWNLCLVGGGADEEKLKSLAKALNLKRVSFEGFQNPVPYYKRAAIFCLTSAYEGFPLVIGEASAFACVPISFNAFPAVLDIISHNENGILVPASDTDQFAENLRRLISDTTFRETLAQNAQVNATRFSMEKILPTWEKLLKGTSD